MTNDYWEPEIEHMDQIDPVKRDYHLRHPINAAPLIWVKMLPPEPIMATAHDPLRYEPPPMVRATLFTRDFRGRADAMWNHIDCEWVLTGSAQLAVSRR